MTAVRAIALVLVVLGVMPIAVGPASAADPYTPSSTEYSYTEFLAHAAAKEIRSVTLRGNLAHGRTADGGQFHAYTPQDPDLVSRLVADGVTVTAEPDNSRVAQGFIWNLIVAVCAITALVYFGTAPRSRDAGSMTADFRRARMKLFDPTLQRVTFAEVAGIDEACQELQEIVQFLHEPKRFTELGAKIPSGILLAGPPGTGKTLLARAIAGEAEVPFFSVSGPDFVELFVGVGASRVRDTFARAREQAPSIIFIDEIDAIGRRRSANPSGQSDEREQTLNQLLVEMDGIEGACGVILIGATNRPESLDPALLRPGRFDRQVAVPVPDAAGRERILAVHLAKLRRDVAIDLTALARGTAGFSGAELANLVNEAALLAARRGRPYVGMAELDAARDKVLMGAERRSLVLIEEDRRRTAYHEAGHALVALALPENGRLQKVTIVPRGRALGLTLLESGADRCAHSKAELSARIAMMCGGRVAEELIYGKDAITTGAAKDIAQATSLARRMVVEFGFSERLGRLSLVDAVPSEAAAELIDSECRRFVQEGEAVARAILKAELSALRRTGAALFKHETLSGGAFRSYAQAALRDR
jgi:cell division protease FtsH